MWKKKGGLDRKRESELDFGTGVIAREEEGGGREKVDSWRRDRGRSFLKKKRMIEREIERESFRG